MEIIIGALLASSILTKLGFSIYDYFQSKDARDRAFRGSVLEKWYKDRTENMAYELSKKNIEMQRKYSNEILDIREKEMKFKEQSLKNSVKGVDYSYFLDSKDNDMLNRIKYRELLS